MVKKEKKENRNLATPTQQNSSHIVLSKLCVLSRQCKENPKRKKLGRGEKKEKGEAEEGEVIVVVVAVVGLWKGRVEEERTNCRSLHRLRDMLSANNRTLRGSFCSVPSHWNSASPLSSATIKILLCLDFDGWRSLRLDN